MDSKDNTTTTATSLSGDKVQSLNDTNTNKPVVVVDTDDENEGFASGQDEPFDTTPLDNDNSTSNTLPVSVKDGDDVVEEAFSEALDVVVDDVENEPKKPENDKLGGKILEDKVGLENLDKVDEVVVQNGVKVTNEGDSVVEEIKVDVPKAEPGVAVVGKTDEVVDKVEVTDDEDVLLVGGPDDDEDEVVGADDDDVKVTSEVEVSGVDESKTVVESRDLGFGGESEEKVTPEGDSVVESAPKDVKEEDSVVEAVDVDLPVAGVPGVAVVTKKEEEGGDVAVVDTEKIDRVLDEVVDKEVVGVTEGKFSPLGDVEVEDASDKNEKNAEPEVEKVVDSEGVENGSVAVKTAVGDVEDVSVAGLEGVAASEDNGPNDKFVLEEAAEKDDGNEEGYDGTPSDEEETDGVVFGSSEAAKQFMEELEGGSSNAGGESSQDRSQRIDGQIVTDSDEEDDDDDEEDGKEIFDSAALAALLKAAADGGSEGGNITFSSQDGSRLFSVERPAGLGPALMRATPRPPRSNLFNGSMLPVTEAETNLTEEERKKLEKLQAIRVKFLRLIQRLGLSTDESVAAQVLYRLALVAGRQTGQAFSLDAARQKAAELEAAGSDDLDFSLNILVIGKAGVGKSATINSIFGEDKTSISAFQPATGSVKEITGMVGGVPIRVFDTPGLKSSIMDQGYNRSVLASAKKFTKKNPPDIVLYVDRLDAQTRDHNDFPLLKTITTSLGPSIWRSVIVTLTHGASAPPEGSNGLTLSYEMFVTQRSHIVQQAIGQAVGDMRMMSPSLMNPVSLVENHQSCRKNRDGQKVLPNGQTWRPQLLLLCYSMKILNEANSLQKPQEPYDSRKLFGFRVRSPPLPYMLSSMLQSRPHPKLSNDQDGGDSDADLADLTDSDNEEDEDEYDQLPPFKPLKKSQLSKLSKEQKKAYFDEYDYRVKLLQKKQWKEEVKRMKEMKKRGNSTVTEQAYPEEDGEGDAPAPVAVPLPDMALPPSFDSDNPAYRFRFLEPTSQFLARPVLDTHGWDHDCGYDGVNLEQTLAIANRFPTAVSVQLTKDKKDFSINMDSSIATKHGDKASTMAGFDIQPIGKQLAYIVRGETKFKNLKRNKTAAGMSVTFLGENVVTGFKVEDQVTLGRQYSIIGSAGTVRFQTDSAYGANIEIQRRELDYPIGQVQSTLGLSIIKWRGDLALGFNSLAQFSAGRNSKVAVRAGINNKMSGQITVKTSSSEHLALALTAVIPSLISAYKKLWPGDAEKYSAY
ncbi:AIG1-like protein [Artemisia annua]|uniref:AIG1-like protein n=1 Tax=Artemisia annua TaxID=35608 RepID=A0A2U1P369_ARTAN|nr:AIG1-like protein [Artemisia annua]